MQNLPLAFFIESGEAALDVLDNHAKPNIPK